MSTKIVNQNVTEESIFSLGEKEKVGTVSLNYLRNSSMILDSRGNPMRTRPVQSWELIDDVLEIIDDNKINFTPDPIYMDRNSATKRMTREERKLYNDSNTPIRYWVFNDLLTRFIFPSTGDDDNDGSLAVSFNNSGIQVAFGMNVKICKNMCILGGNILRSYGNNKIEYSEILNNIRKWVSNLEQFVTVEMNIMKKLQQYVIWSKQVDGEDQYMKIEDQIIGNIYKNAVYQNYIDIKNQTAINQHNSSRFCQSLLKKRDSIIQDEEFTAWDLYNIGTNILKPGNLDTKLIIDNCYMWIIQLSSMFNTAFVTKS